MCVCVLTGLCASRACSWISASSRIGGGSVLSVVHCHRVPPSHLVHVAHHRGGPCHFVTIFGIRVVRVRRMACRRGCARSAHTPLGLQLAGRHRRARLRVCGRLPRFPRRCKARAAADTSTARTRAHLAPPGVLVCNTRPDLSWSRQRFLSLHTQRRDDLTLSATLSRTLSRTLQLGSPHGFPGPFDGEPANASSVAMSVELEGY